MSKERTVERNLKPIDEQVIVITGASSGIGLATARMAAERGARLVLASRSEESLSKLQEEIYQHGGKAIHVQADVGIAEDVERIRAVAEQEFGGFDTWVNNAGVSIYGKLDEVSMEDCRKLFDTNFWGVVYGSLTALRHLKKRGGAIINIGSVASDTAIPLQGMYSATKSAVKGFTDALRMEIEADGLPVSVTLIKPGVIDTPYAQHAKSYFEDAPANPRPMYAPEVVAQAILRCAETPRAEVVIGGFGKLMSLAGRYVPRIRDIVYERLASRIQHSGRQLYTGKPSILDQASEDLRERGGDSRATFERSLYTQTALHPVISGLALFGGCLALAALLQAMRGEARQISARGSAL
jgi:short-subunit dehydrogenase